MKKLLLLFSILVCLSCGQEKAKPVTHTDFQFTECGAFYKGNRFPSENPSQNGKRYLENIREKGTKILLFGII